MRNNDRRRPPTPGHDRTVSRRNLLKGGLALGAAGVAGTGLSSSAGAALERAMSVTAPSNATLRDIKHVVILMQENRSFDHYFGTMSGVRGFSDPGVRVNDIFGTDFSVFKQFGYKPGGGVDSGSYMVPFHLDQRFPNEQGECTNDITHEWGAQHHSWNRGKMDSWVQAHLAGDGVPNFASSMGYFTRADIPFYYALADAFTICDHYFCSVLGPTDPNRTMALTGTIDPDGSLGGPVLITQVQGRPKQYGKFGWETMPERLLDAGVSFKVYNDPTGLALFSPLPYFKAYTDPTSTRGAALIEKAIAPSYPANLLADVQTGQLPQVSWIHGPVTQCEHPATAPQWGENFVQTVLNILTSNPEVWAQTLFILHYDENGGFFDHVAPPTPPKGTEGEFLTMHPLPADASGMAGPVGLGFRVPCFVISPFSAGGHVSSEVFDHTSTLRLIETLFGVEVPNLSAWRRGVTGDMTGALSLGKAPDPRVPHLPDASLLVPLVDEQVIVNALFGTFDKGFSYPPPTENVMPVQESTPARPAPVR
ncbi:MAG TPA: alkaline phosphatase family protein [Acidimicrobiales bacterium]|nr:alkaline phosphatase family protein [Acidimicrobiales bacterium]